MTGPSHRVDFDALPVAALLLQDEVIVAVNPAYTSLLGVSADELVGLTSDQLVAAYVMPVDLPRLERDRVVAVSDASSAGTIRLRVTDSARRVRSLRIEWRLGETPGSSVVYLVDDDPDSRVKELADGLARKSAALAVARTEDEVLVGAVDAIVERGFEASFLLARAGTDVLEQGPNGSPRMDANMLAARKALTGMSVPVDVLRAFNPRFDEGHAAFFPDVDLMVARLFPDLAEVLQRARLGPHFVEVPLIVSGALFGVLFVSGEALTPGLAGPIEMFGELIERAIEAIRMRRRLLEGERLAALGEAAAVMAHEVRNPVAAMLNAVTLLQRDAMPREALVAMIAEEAGRLERIVTDLLTLGRPLEPRLVAVELVTVLRKAWSLLGARGSTADVELVGAAELDGLEVVVDADLLELALVNVLRNAVEASPAGGAVRVCLGSCDDMERVAVAVDDEGSGFPSEVLERAFEPFFTTRPTGTGIGLAVVRRVIEASDGRVVIGEAPNGGARVSLLLRRAPSSA